MDAARHWKRALPFYLQVSLRYSAIGWAPSLAIAFLGSIWIGLTKHRLVVNRESLAFALIFGTLFFFLTFLTAVGHDLYRNRGTQEATIAWNPLLVWRIFLYGGALFFFVAAFLAYHQGLWLSVLFVLFSTASAITAKVWL